MRLRAGLAWKPALAVAMVLVTAVCTLGSALALSMPDLPIPLPIGLAAARDAHRSVAGGQRDGLARARAYRSVLSAAPTSSEAWLGLAMVRADPGGHLNAADISAVQTSYAVAPLGPDVSYERVQFLYEHWGDLTPALRRRVLEETEVLVRYRNGSRLFQTVSDLRGRLAADLKIRAAWERRLADERAHDRGNTTTG